MKIDLVLHKSLQCYNTKIWLLDTTSLMLSEFTPHQICKVIRHTHNSKLHVFAEGAAAPVPKCFPQFLSLFGQEISDLTIQYGV